MEAPFVWLDERSPEGSQRGQSGQKGRMRNVSVFTNKKIIKCHT